jgi:hypothetical protein
VQYHEPELHAERLYDPAAPPAAEIKRLSTELMATFAELLKCVLNAPQSCFYALTTVYRWTTMTGIGPASHLSVHI